MRAQAQRHAALSRQLSDIRLRKCARTRIGPLESSTNLQPDSDSGDELNALVSDANDQALYFLREAFIRSGSQSARSVIDNQSPDEAGPQHQRSTRCGNGRAPFGGDKFAQISGR
jgi:hypothetical protein